MARVYDLSGDYLKDPKKLISDWPMISMKIAAKMRLTQVEDLVQFGKVLSSKQGVLVTELNALKSSYQGNSLGSGLFGNNLSNTTRMSIVAKIVAPQMKVQLAMTTLAIHERNGDGGPYIALVLHKAMGQKEILTSKASTKAVGAKIMAKTGS